jgi:hypothetical protein
VAAQLARGSGESWAGQEVADLLTRLGHDGGTNGDHTDGDATGECST